MRNAMVASLFVSAVNAQSTMTYLNLLWSAEPTLTRMSSDATATTYEKHCDTTTASFVTGSTSLPSTGPPTTASFTTSSTDAPWLTWPSTPMSPEEESSYLSSYVADPSVQAFFSTHVPATTPTAEAEICVPFTLIQGPETWGFHVTLAQPGLLTRNGGCTWTGAFTEVSVTCDAELKGTLYSVEFPSGSPTTMGQEELRTYTDMRFAVATVVEATPTATSKTGATSGISASGASGAAVAGSSGFAAGGPRPTGLMAIVGGAAAIGAAAWAY